MFVIEHDVYVCEIQGDITMCVWVCVVVFTVHLCVCVCASTRDLVQALSGDVVILIDPFSVTFEVDLGCRRCPAA